MDTVYNGTLGTVPREKSNRQMHVFGSNVEKFFGQKGHFFFEGLYQSVNRQALAPFFRQAVFWGLFPHFINEFPPDIWILVNVN